MTTLNLHHIAAALDGCTNVLGMELSQDARATIYAAIETVTGPDGKAEAMRRWGEARNIIVSEEGAGLTLWAAVVQRWGDWWASPTALPGGFAILAALEALHAKKGASA